VTGHSANAQTGTKTETVVTTTVRWVFKQPTQYMRLYRAEQTQTRVGDTTFIMWLPDVESTFTSLTQEDYITYAGERYEVVSSSVEDQAFVVTARKFE
jgi:hypothetical protein